MVLGSVVIAVLIGCSGGPSLTAQQEQGKRIYESLCDKCHKLLPPKNFSDDQWGSAVQKYGVPLKLKTNELAMLTAYLQRANDADF